MKPTEQKQFVRDLLANFTEKIEGNIDSGVIPPEWDGIELRELIFDMARDSRALSRVGLNASSKRIRDYRDLVLVSPELF